MFKAVIFDLDETVFNYERPQQKALEYISKKYFNDIDFFERYNKVKNIVQNRKSGHDKYFYFKELEIDYLTYQTYKFCGISENDLQGVHHDVRYSDIEMVTKTFLLTRVRNKIMHSYQPNIKIVLHDDFKRLVRDDFLKRRPNAVKALNNYIANVYVRYKYLFLHDCGWGLHNLLFYLAGAPPYIKGTINGNELLVSMIDWNDIQYRCSVVLEAAFSNEEYRKAVFPTFNSLMDLFEKIKCDPMHYYNEGEDARNIILGCFKNALLKTGILVVLIKTQQQANEVEKIMPGIIHNVNVSEMIKNRQVIGLARLRKTNLFSTLHKDVIKIVLNHTAIPEPEELLSHDKPHKRKK